MSKVTVLGANGMLGGMMVKVLKSYGHEVRGVGRDVFEVGPAGNSIIGIKLSRVLDPDTQYVINCIGAIKPAFKGDIVNAIYTNAVFPRQLANVCEAFKRSLIHITTDCVFDGANGPYDENSKHNATDEYGKSKSLGEPTNCLVIRTSIIGPEFGGNKKSLLEWVRGQGGKEISGFTNHLWNGLTTKELAGCVSSIMKRELFENGTFHLFSEDVTKAELVSKIAKAYNIDCKINNIEAPTACDRRLRSIKKLQRFVAPSTLDEMLEDLVDEV